MTQFFSLELFWSSWQRKTNRLVWFLLFALLVALSPFLYRIASRNVYSITASHPDLYFPENCFTTAVKRGSNKLELALCTTDFCKCFSASDYQIFFSGRGKHAAFCKDLTWLFLLSFKQEEHISLLRKLLLYITELPQTSSRFLINNLVSKISHQ